MKITVDQIAGIVNGTVIGDGKREINRFAPIEEAGEGAITFLSNPKYSHYLYETQAEAVLVSKDFKAEKEVSPALIMVEDVYTTLSILLDKFQNTEAAGKNGIEQPSFISASAAYGENIYLGAFSYLGENVKIGNNVKIYPQVFVGDNVTIDDNTIVFAGVKVYANCIIGKYCILHSGSVIGSDGFGFAPQPDGSYKKMPQTGNVIIKDNVEVGANTTIDRATIQATVIEDGVKLDNLIQIAHNVEIGANTVIAAQTGISGSTKIGQNCVIAGQVGIVGHIQVADKTMIGAQSGIAKAVKEPGTKWFGSPADDYKRALKTQVIIKQLPDIYNRVLQLEKQIKDIINPSK
jgi:UDP-3-O-[3-hydroxymyristoyl] glucosamine N-acyltransferase